MERKFSIQCVDIETDVSKCKFVFKNRSAKC